MEKLKIKFHQKNKFRFFFLFLFLSFSFWIITKLSNTYSSSVSFSVKLEDVPDLIIPKNTDSLVLKIYITGSGFELLLYNFFNDEIVISARNAEFKTDYVEVDLLNQIFSIQQQLYQNTIVGRLETSSISFNFDRLVRKKVPILPVMKIDYKLGFERTEDWKVAPDSVWITGSSNLLDTLIYYPTETFKKFKVDMQIDELIQLKKNLQLKFDFSEVRISADVQKFTEKTVETFVSIKNLPDTLSIKLFPQRVKSTFLVLIDNVDKIKSNDFLFYCDFNDTQIGTTNNLNVKLDNPPIGVRNIRWEPKKLDYLIRQ